MPRAFIPPFPMARAIRLSRREIKQPGPFNNSTEPRNPQGLRALRDHRIARVVYFSATRTWFADAGVGSTRRFPASCGRIGSLDVRGVSVPVDGSSELSRAAPFFRALSSDILEDCFGSSFMIVKFLEV